MMHKYVPLSCGLTGAKAREKRSLSSLSLSLFLKTVAPASCTYLSRPCSSFFMALLPHCPTQRHSTDMTKASRENPGQPIETLVPDSTRTSSTRSMFAPLSSTSLISVGKCRVFFLRNHRLNRRLVYFATFEVPPFNV